jgi:hypothetical protein
MRWPEFLRRPWRAILACASAAAILAWLLAPLLAEALERHEVTLAFTINQRPRQETKEYAYDGYYALRASELFADTLIGWFQTPSVVKGIYEGNAAVEADPASAVRNFRAKKYSSQTVVVRFRERFRSVAEAMAERAVAIVTAKTEELNRDARGDSLFVLVPAEPIVVKRVPSRGRLTFIGLLLGAATGAMLAYLAASPRKDEKAP